MSDATSEVAPGEHPPEGEAAEPAAPAPARPRRAAGATTTTMVHSGGRGRPEWWRRAVIYELTAQELSSTELDSVTAGATLASRLGVDGLLIHPGTAPVDAPDAARALVRRTQQLGLRLMISLRQHEDRVDLLRQWLRHGAQGVDVGGIAAPEEDRLGAADLGALHALVAELVEEGILAGAATASDPAELLVHLQEAWPHHLRDDRLAAVPWSASRIRRTITEAYGQRDPLGAPAAWTMHDPLAGGYTAEPGTGISQDRFRAAALLTLALPGSVYLRQGEEVGLTDGAAAAGPRAAGRAELIRHLVHEQRGTQDSTYEMFRHALRLRHELRLGTGPLGWVDGLPQAAAETTVAFVNRQVIVLANTGTESIQLPPPLEILHASSALVPAPGGGVDVPPETTVWAQLEPHER